MGTDDGLYACGLIVRVGISLTDLFRHPKPQLGDGGMRVC